METTEGNILIAEFICKSHYPVMHGGKDIEYYDMPTLPMNDDDNHTYWELDLHFHTSWDWLMPVVDKIENLKEEAIGYGYTISVDMGRDWCAIKFNDFSSKIIVAKSIPNNKISSVWEAVVSFIQWHNQLTQNKER